MKRYWDSSALIAAFQNPALQTKIFEPEQFTRPHTLAESFSTLTGGRLGFKCLPDDAAKMLEDITANVEFVELNAAETKAAISEAQSRGVRGGRIHDWLHARAAHKAGVVELITENIRDFQGLEDGFIIAPP